MNTEQRLWKIFDTVNAWLEFAEKKNAAALAVVGLQLGAERIFIDFQHSGFLLKLHIVLLLIAALVFFLSFIPIIKVPDFLAFMPQALEKKSDSDNPIFFGHISKYSVNEYTALLAGILKEPSMDDNSWLRHICAQIVVNSSVAGNKYRAFNRGAIFFGFAQIVLVITLCRQQI